MVKEMGKRGDQGEEKKKKDELTDGRGSQVFDSVYLQRLGANVTVDMLENLMLDVFGEGPKFHRGGEPVVELMPNVGGLGFNAKIHGILTPWDRLRPMIRKQKLDNRLLVTHEPDWNLPRNSQGKIQGFDKIMHDKLKVAHSVNFPMKLFSDAVLAKHFGGAPAVNDWATFQQRGGFDKELLKSAGGCYLIDYTNRPHFGNPPPGYNRYVEAQFQYPLQTMQAISLTNNNPRFSQYPITWILDVGNERVPGHSHRDGGERPRGHVLCNTQRKGYIGVNKEKLDVEVLLRDNKFIPLKKIDPELMVGNKVSGLRGVCEECGQTNTEILGLGPRGTWVAWRCPGGCKRYYWPNEDFNRGAPCKMWAQMERENGDNVNDHAENLDTVLPGILPRYESIEDASYRIGTGKNFEHRYRKRVTARDHHTSSPILEVIRFDDVVMGKKKKRRLTTVRFEVVKTRFWTESCRAAIGKLKICAWRADQLYKYDMKDEEWVSHPSIVHSSMYTQHKSKILAVKPGSLPTTVSIFAIIPSIRQLNFRVGQHLHITPVPPTSNMMTLKKSFKQWGNEKKEQIMELDFKIRAAVTRMTFTPVREEGFDKWMRFAWTLIVNVDERDDMLEIAQRLEHFSIGVEVYFAGITGFDGSSCWGWGVLNRFWDNNHIQLAGYSRERLESVPEFCSLYFYASLEQFHQQQNPQRAAVPAGFYDEDEERDEDEEDLLASVMGFEDEEEDEEEEEKLRVIEAPFSSYMHLIPEEKLKAPASMPGMFARLDRYERSMRDIFLLPKHGVDHSNFIQTGLARHGKAEIADAILNSCNKTQRENLWSMLEKHWSMTIGPPGTGKTSTVGDGVCFIYCMVKGLIVVSASSNFAADEAMDRIIGKKEKFNLMEMKVVRLVADPRAEFDIDFQRGTNIVHLMAMEDDRFNFPDEEEMIELLDEWRRVGFERLSDDQQKALVAHRSSVEIKIIREADVVVVTSSVFASHKINMAAQKRSISLAVFDEASRNDQGDIIPCMQLNPVRSWFVGDPHQLHPVFNSSSADRTGLSIPLMYLLQMTPVFSQPGSVGFLETQYRMHDQMCQVVSRLCYDNKLVTAAEVFERDYSDYKLFSEQNPRLTQNHVTVLDYWIDEGLELKKNGGITNAHEVKIIKKLLIRMRNGGLDPKKITVMAYYDAQVKALKEMTAELGGFGEQIKCHSVDAMQGRESDVVILSAVRSNDMKSVGFLNEDHRINVSISRGRDYFYFVGNCKLFREFKVDVMRRLMRIFKDVGATFFRNFVSKSV